MGGSALSAQNQVGAIFLLISPSPVMNGMGEIGTALPTDDLYGIHYNPANFRSAAGLQVAYSFPSRTAWLKALNPGIGLHVQALQIGLTALPLIGEISAGYYQTFLDLGLQINTDEEANVIGTFKSYMIADVVTLGLRRQFRFRSLSGQVALGIARKDVVQNLATGFSSGTGPDIRSFNRFTDTGFLASVHWVTAYGAGHRLKVRTAVGYSLLNDGDGIDFNLGFGPDPPPTTARIGWSVALAFLEAEGDVPRFSLTYGREVSDVLVVSAQQDAGWKWTVDYPLGDIKARHLFTYDPAAPVILHEGWELNVLNRLALRQGNLPDPAGRLFQRTYGAGLDLSPLVVMLANGLGAPGLAGNIVLRYDFSTWARGLLDGTNFHGLTLSFRRLEQLLPSRLRNASMPSR